MKETEGFIDYSCKWARSQGQIRNLCNDPDEARSLGGERSGWGFICEVLTPSECPRVRPPTGGGRSRNHGKHWASGEAGGRDQEQPWLVPQSWQQPQAPARITR